MEGGYQRHGSNSGKIRRYVFRPRGARNDSSYIYRHPNQSMRLNFFSSVSSLGVGNLYFYSKMNGAVYCEVMNKLIADLKTQFGHENFRIVHDNAKFSSSISTRNFLRDHNLNRFFLPIPPYSPDMNIIENLWALLKHYVKIHTFTHGRVSSRAEFSALIQHFWFNTSPQTVSKLFESLPIRMNTILTSEGKLTRY